MAHEIHTKAPMRFDMAGGPTDVSPFAELEGGTVVNVAIQKYAKVSLLQREDNQIHIQSADMGKDEVYTRDEIFNFDGPLRLLKASISYVLPNSGVDINTFVDSQVGSGLGASASLAIALLGALKISKNESYTPESLAEDALYIENELLHNVNGGQDQYASALGGIHLFRFSSDGIKFQKLCVEPDVISEIERKSLLVYSGESRVSGDVLTRVMHDYLLHLRGIDVNLREIKDCAERIGEMLVSGNIANLGATIAKVFFNQRQLHPSVVTANIERIFEIAKTLGIEGGKIAGAGGGGTALIYADMDNIKSISYSLTENGYLTSPMQISQAGFEYKIV